MSRNSFRFVVALCLLSGGAVESFAQSITSGAVTGTISDPSGAPIPDATVILTNIGTSTAQNDTTSAEGSYRLLSSRRAITRLLAGPAVLRHRNAQV
jgi:hypothetical protein